MKFCIVGSGRCGTTLLGHIFNDHPDVLLYLESYWHAAMFARYGLAAVAPRLLQDVVRRTTFPGGTPVIHNTLRFLDLPVEQLFTHLAVIEAYRLGDPQPTLN